MDRLETHLMTIENKLGEDSPTPAPYGIRDRLDWHLTKIEELIPGGGGGGSSTYQPFPSSWPTNSTIKAFCDAVNADSTATVGMAYLGDLSCSDLPTGLNNVDANVEIMDGPNGKKTIHVVCSSGSIAPYHWEYTYWNDGTDVSGWIVLGTEEADIETVNYVVYGKLTDAQIDKLKKGKLCITYSYGQTLIHHFYEYEDADYYYLSGCQYFWQQNGAYVPKKCKINHYVIKVFKTEKFMVLDIQDDLSAVRDDSSNFFDAATAPASNGKRLVRELNVYNKLLPAFASGDAGKVLKVNSGETGVEWGSGGGSSAPMTEILWADLKALRDAGTLVPGMRYRITDYAFTSAKSGITSANHPFDIIVTALSTSLLDTHARACPHAGDTYYTNAGCDLGMWELIYILDHSNHIPFPDWASTYGTYNKGAIIYMKDDRDNVCWYDFKNVLFSGKFTFDLYLNGQHKDYTVVTTGVYGNYISYSGDTLTIHLPQNIFEATSTSDACIRVRTSPSATSNSFHGVVYDINLKDSCYSNSFTGCNNIDLDFYCHHNTFNSGCQHIKCGQRTNHVDFTNVAAENVIIDPDCEYLEFVTAVAGNDPIRNIHVHMGVKGESGTPKTISIDRGLAYETNVQAIGTTTIDV